MTPYERAVKKEPWVKEGKVAYRKRLYEKAIAALVDARLLGHSVSLSSNWGRNTKSTKARMHLYYYVPPLQPWVDQERFVSIARWKQPGPVSLAKSISYEDAAELIEKYKDQLKGQRI